MKNVNPSANWSDFSTFGNISCADIYSSFAKVRGSLAAFFVTATALVASVSHAEGASASPSTAARLAAVAGKYAYVDPQHLVPDNLLLKALAKYDASLSSLHNRKYLTVVDFSSHSSYARFYIIDMGSGAVEALHVAHGKGSDPSNSGYATKFGNVSGSEKSSLGYYQTAEVYNGKHGLSLRLDGLSSTNSNARARDIVIHGASYVYDRNARAGRSWGCLALSTAQHERVIQMLKGGSLIYAGLSQAQTRALNIN